MSECYQLFFNDFFRLYSFLLPPGKVKNLVAKCFGMRVGRNVKICKETQIYNPDRITIGDNTLIGTYSLITCHLEENRMIVMKPVSIGSDCLIGGGTWIFPGVKIGNNVVVGARSVIPKNKELPANSVWAGNPVRRIK